MGDGETMEGVNEKDPSWCQRMKESTKVLMDEIKTIKGWIIYFQFFELADIKDRTCIGYDNVIVLVLVWLTFVSLYPIVKV